MNGLLDFVKTPEGQGLLSAAFGGLAGARRGQPINSLGRAGLAGLAGYSGAQDRAVQAEESAFNKQFKTAQLTKMQQEMTASQARNDYLNRLGGAPTEALGAGAATGDVGPTKTNAARMDGLVPPALQRIPQDALRAEIALNGGKNIPEWMFKTGTPDMQVSNGFAYDKNNTQPGFMPQMSVSNDGKATQTTIGPDGMPTVGAPRGALATYGAYLAAGEDAKAQRDLVTVPTSDGRVRTMPRSEALTATAGNSNPVQTSFPTQGNARMTSDLYGLIQADAAKNGIGQPIINLNSDRPNATYTVGNPTQVGVQQSEAEKAAAVAKAKSDAEAGSGIEGQKRAARKEAAATSAANVIGAIDEAVNLVGYNTAGPLAGLASIPGTPARDLQSKIETIKANLGFDRLQQMRDMSPTGGALGSVAVQELTALQSTVSSLDQAQSPAQLRASFAKIKQHYEKWRDTIMSEGSDGGASANFDNKPAQAFDSKPPAQQYKGKSMRGPDGKRYQSDGMIWKEVQ